MIRAWVALGVLFAVSVAAAHQPGEAETSIELKKGKVTIHYGTPTLGSRNLDDMIQPGVAWRMGMNGPTTLETTVNLDFGGKRLPAGKYSLFARPDAGRNWMLLVSRSTTSMMLDPSTVVLEAPLQFNKDAVSQDVLKITLSNSGPGGTLVVAWGTYRLQGTFKTA